MATDATELSRRTLWQRVRDDVLRNRHIYIMLAPVVLYYLLFHYQPMYGAQIAFKNFSPVRGIWRSQWAGRTAW